MTLLSGAVAAVPALPTSHDTGDGDEVGIVDKGFKGADERAVGADAEGAAAARAGEGAEVAAAPALTHSTDHKRDVHGGK
jgi:hypothetical protein